MSLKIEEIYDKIYRYCYFKTYCSDVAEDMTQETFLKYFSQNTYIERGKSLAYLFTIARNLCMDYHRKKKEQPLTEDLSIEESYSNIEMSYAIKEALHTLPKQTQELLLLRYANELSVNEISRIMELSRFTVYRKITAGLKDLKNTLREEDFY